MAQRKIPSELENLPSNNLTTPNRRQEILPEDYHSKRRKGKVSSDIRNMGNGVLERLILPGIQNLFLEVVDESLSQIMESIRVAIFGEGSGSYRSRRSRHRSYDKMYTSYDDPPIRRRRANRRIGYDHEFDDIFFNRRDQARRALAYLNDRIDKFGHATLGDFYGYIGKSANITDESWGWDNLSRVRIEYTSEGYLIAFPDPIVLN